MKSEGDYTDSEAKLAKGPKRVKRSMNLAEQAAEVSALRTYGTCNHPAHKNGSVFYPRIKGMFWMMAGFWALLLFVFVPAVAYRMVLGLEDKVDALEGSDVARVVARAVEVDTTTSATDSACTALSGTAYPTPSSASVPGTMHAPSASLTGGVFVTSMTSASTSGSDSACAAQETVTVTVTSQATADAVTGTVSAGGAPPQSSETSTTVFTTITMTSTLTSTATLDQTTMTTTEHPSLVPTLGAGTGNGIGVYGTGYGTGTGFIHGTGTGTGTASFGLQPSANGSLTYSMPSVTPSHPLTTVVSSSASTIGGGSKGDHQQRGSKSGFYCIVMAVACGLVLAVV